MTLMISCSVLSPTAPSPPPPPSRRTSFSTRRRRRWRRWFSPLIRILIQQLFNPFFGRYVCDINLVILISSLSLWFSSTILSMRSKPNWTCSLSSIKDVRHMKHWPRKNYEDVVIYLRCFLLAHLGRVNGRLEVVDHQGRRGRDHFLPTVVLGRRSYIAWRFFLWKNTLFFFKLLTFDPLTYEGRIWGPVASVSLETHCLSEEQRQDKTGKGHDIVGVDEVAEDWGGTTNPLS